MFGKDVLGGGSEVVHGGGSEVVGGGGSAVDDKHGGKGGGD